jgi:hypothetical protein
MPTSVRLRRLIVPASVGLILLVAVGWYNFFWLPHTHRYLDDRNFRVLKTLSEQIRLGINNFDKMMDNAADSGISNDKLQDYLSHVAPQLEKPDDEETESIIGKGDSSNYGDPPKISVVADEGTHFLYMAFKRTVKAPVRSTRDKQVRYAIRTDLGWHGTMEPSSFKNHHPASKWRESIRLRMNPQPNKRKKSQMRQEREGSNSRGKS